jgi:Protein of unknown function (DUF2971)
MPDRKLPRKLYKYKSFGVNCLRLLSEAEVYYANPQSFNDPLDCDPSILIDTDLASLEKLYYKMLVTFKGKEKTTRSLRNHRYMSMAFGDYKTDSEAQNYYIQSLGDDIKNILVLEMNVSGVLSLSEKWNCPLMWSHYADEHRGVCIEYDQTNTACGIIKPVSYNRPRSIKISELIDWKIFKSALAEKNIQDTYYFAKASQWRYEREWRVINSSNGVNPSPFRITGIYFGMRCDSAVQTSVVKLLANTQYPVDFYDIYPLKDTFQLKKRLVNADELIACGVQTSVLLDFKDIVLDIPKQ